MIHIGALIVNIIGTGSTSLLTWRKLVESRCCASAFGAQSQTPFSNRTMMDAVQFHDKIAGSWEQGYQSEAFAVRISVLDRLLAPLDLNGQHWLDAGCGTGTLGRWLAGKKMCTVTAVDASESMLANAAPCDNVFYQRANVQSLPFPASTFDGAICSSVLEYQENPLQILRELRRVLKPDALLLASVPRNSLRQKLFVRTFYWLTRPLGRRRLFTALDYSQHSYSEPAFAALLSDAGFSVRECIPFGKARVELSHGWVLRSSDPSLMMVFARAV